MTYLLDTNTLIARLNNHIGVARRLQPLSPVDVLLAAPVLAELYFGAHLSARRAENLARVDRLAAAMPIVPFGDGCARRFGEMKATLRRQGVTKSDFDLAIAAIALESGAILVSNDQAFHDSTLPGLRVEDWLNPQAP